MILLSQVLNGVLLPFVLIYMILLINKTRPDGRMDQSALVQRWSPGSTVVIMIGLTLALVGHID